MPEPERLLAHFIRWSALILAVGFAAAWLIKTPMLAFQPVGLVLLGALLGRALRRWRTLEQPFYLTGNLVVGAVFYLPIAPEVQRATALLLEVAIFVLLTPPGGGRMRRRISETVRKARVWARGIPLVGGAAARPAPCLDMP